MWLDYVACKHTSDFECTIVIGDNEYRIITCTLTICYCCHWTPCSSHVNNIHQSTTTIFNHGRSSQTDQSKHYSYHVSFRIQYSSNETVIICVVYTTIHVCVCIYTCVCIRVCVCVRVCTMYTMYTKSIVGYV